MDLLPLFLDATRQELRRAGDGELVDAPGWLQITQPGAKVVWRNGVHHAVLEASEADARIAATRAHYEAAGVPFLWRVTPGCRPRDLPQRLAAQGFARFETLACLCADPADFDAPDPAGPAVEEVDESTLEDYLAVLAPAWGMPPEGVERFRQITRRELQRPDPVEHFYLARIDGAPAGLAAMSYVPQSVHFTGGAVVPSARGRGVYKQLILHRMQVLRARGAALVSVHAVSNTSAPICEHLGFREALRMETWCYPASEAPAQA